MGLGTLRFVLSLMVIDTHFGVFARPVQLAVTQWLGLERVGYIGSGGIAVSGFFVISGYLITMVLDRRYAPGWRGAAAFYASRALRIYPLYWLVLAGYVAALYALRSSPGFSPAQWLGNVTLLPWGALGMVADPNVPGTTELSAMLLIGPAWTLCYDLLFYLFAPWLFLRARTSAWVALLGLGYFLLFIALADPRPPVWYRYFYQSGVPYLFMFACGALAYHHRRRIQFRRSWACAAIAGLAWVTYFPLGMTNSYFNQLFAGVVFSVLVAMLGQRPHLRRIDRGLGDLTYATYLLHLPLLSLAQVAGLAYPALTAFVLTYVLSTALLFAFEAPLDRLRDHMHDRYRARPSPPASATMLSAMPLVLMVALVATAVIALRANLWNAGEQIAWRTEACPAQWRCDENRIDIAGAGEASLQPELRAMNRLVIDLAVAPGEGEAWAGLVGNDGKFRVGIARRGAACRLEITDGTRVDPEPAGWNSECRGHRLVFNRGGETYQVVVDSLWLPPPVSAPAVLRPMVRAGPDARGTVTFGRTFVTR